MTNYEWLIENGKLERFVCDCHSMLWCDVCEKYKIDIAESSVSTAVANWLQSEHKANKWVRLDDVINTLANNPWQSLNALGDVLETKEIEDV